MRFRICSAIALAFSLSVGSSFFAEDSFAQATGVSTSSSSTVQSPWSATWKATLSGPTFSEPDGLAGEGSNIKIKNQWRLNYSFAKDWTARITPIVEYRSGSPKSEAALDIADPYVGLKKKNLVKWNAAQLSLTAEARYYIPVSDSTKAGVGSKKDKGNGRGMFRIQAFKYFGDSDFNFFGDYTLKRDFAKDAQEDGTLNNWELLNFVQYKAASNLKPYVVYKNFVTTYRDGTGDEWVKNHQIGVGARWKPLKTLTVDPSFNSKFMLKDTEFRLEAVYRFI